MAPLGTERDGKVNPYALWLFNVRGFSSIQIRMLYKHGGLLSAQQLFEMSEREIRELCETAYLGAARERENADNDPKKDLKKNAADYAERTSALLTSAIRECPARNVLSRAEDLAGRGIRFVSMEDPGYPERLRQIDMPPYGLYYRGYLPSDDTPSAAVIGAREATGYGLEQARIFSGVLASAGVQIISGMARGIDGTAEEEALDCRGASFGILGSGVDVCYPAGNRRIYTRMCSGENGSGVISEYGPGTLPKRNFFPARNRLISGLADLLLVCEARTQSGTLITADRALEQGIEVYAIPGRTTDALSAGCNNLIRQGAGIALCPQDLLDFLFGVRNRSEDGPSAEESAREGSAVQDTPRIRLTDRAEQALYDSLDETDLQELDVLREKMESLLGRGVSAREAGAVMAHLLISGLALQPCAGYYCRAIEKGKGKM